MATSDLTRDQRYQLLESVGQHADYWVKLRERMDALSWSKDDPLYVAGSQACEAGEDAVWVLGGGRMVKRAR